MPDVDEAIAATAVGLNEDAKAARKAKGKGKAETAPEPEVVTEPKPGELDEALGNLGDAVAREESNYDLSEGAHETAIERMEANSSNATIDSRSLIPDVRDFLLQTIKDRPKPWAATSNAEQRDVAAACEHAATELVRKIVEAVAANGAAEPIRCLLVGYTDKADAIKVDMKLKAATEEETSRAVLALHKAKGRNVLVTVASIEDFKADGREAELMDDEPALDFEAGGAPPEDDSDLAGEEPDEEIEAQRAEDAAAFDAGDEELAGN